MGRGGEKKKGKKKEKERPGPGEQAFCIPDRVDFSVIGLFLRREEGH